MAQQTMARRHGKKKRRKGQQEAGRLSLRPQVSKARGKRQKEGSENVSGQRKGGGEVRTEGQRKTEKHDQAPQWQEDKKSDD